MTTYTIYADVFVDGYVYSDGTGAVPYATVRAGNALVEATGASHTLGQIFVDPDYQCDEAFARFDCSVIDAGETVSAAVLNTYVTTDQSDTDFTMEARSVSLGAAFDTGDWVAGASLGAQTLRGSLATLGLTASAYNAFSDTAMAAIVDAKSATTDLILNSSLHRAGTTPTGFEYVTIEGATHAGTTQDPYLAVTAASLGQPTVKRFAGVRYMATNRGVW